MNFKPVSKKGMALSMKQGMIQIYSGEGHGKSSAALGRAIKAASQNKTVIIIQFLKGIEVNDFIKRLEPEIKFFHFEKSQNNFNELTEEQQKAEIQNIHNGLKFAKKVLSTEACDMLILDEVLGLIDNKIITNEDLKSILESKPENMTLIMTGIQLSMDTCVIADEVSKIETVKFKVFP